MAVDFSVRMRPGMSPRVRRGVQSSMRRDTMSPEVDIESDVPSPGVADKSTYRRHILNAELSPNDTPRKNKRKLSEPKRRTTDFSIKRLCPDSPGSVCSESGRSEESTPERLNEESRDSPSEGIPSLHNSDLKPALVFPDMRHHPYFIPQFYYHRFSDPLSSYPQPPVPGRPPHHPGLSVPEGLQCATNAFQNSAAARPPSLSHPHPSAVRYPHNSDCSSRVTSSSSSSQSCTTKMTPSSVGGAESRVEQENRDQDSDSGDSSKDGSSKKSRKNYKNMTRERRVEANARERSRVHTISAAFDGLRRAVPSYSYNQKLSKLAILRIACSYINALSQLTASDDNPSDSDKSAFGECVDHCTQTIQTEGKARRRH